MKIKIIDNGKEPANNKDFNLILSLITIAGIAVIVSMAVPHSVSSAAPQLIQSVPKVPMCFGH